MDAPLVSVLMAVYNAEPWLETAVRSLLNQSLSNIEVLAVDDASTDGSLALLQRMAAEDGRLRVFSQTENQGQAVARNRALGEARGEYVCMVDADDWLSGDALEAAVDAFRRHPNADSVVFRLVNHYEADGHEEPYSKRDGETKDKEAWLGRTITGEEAFRLSLDWTLHGLYMVRRELHLHYPFDDSYRLYSDDNTTRLHYLHSREVAFCEGVYYYRRHAQSTTTAITPRRFLHMMANLSMKQTLEREGVGREVIGIYETYRWQNYVGQLWLYFDNKGQFTPNERNRLRNQFCSVYRTFKKRLPFVVAYAGQWLRWRTKRYR